MSTRFVNVLGEYFLQKSKFREEKRFFYKTLCVLGMSMTFIGLRMWMVYLILDKIHAGSVLWVIFWIQFPFILSLDLLERMLLRRRAKGLE